MTNPNENSRKTAIALSYDANTGEAPRVSAKGKGLVAEEIITRAKESGVPIQEDASLVEVLSRLELDERIPEDLYKAVAEVFAFIYKLDKKAGDEKE